MEGGFIFPCGTPDPGIIVDGKVDLDLSLRRELKEETGLDMSGFEPSRAGPWSVDGGLIAQIKVLRSKELATRSARAHSCAHLASEKRPELADIRIVRGPGDFDPAMPGYATAFIASRFRPAGSSRLPDQGDQSETGGVAILRVAGQILFQEALFVEQSPEKHGYQREGDQQAPIRAKRERGREKQQQGARVKRMPDDCIEAGRDDGLVRLDPDR